MDVDNFFQSKVFKGFLIGILCLIILVVVFKMGMLVGTMRTAFSYRWAEQYHKNFAGPGGGFLDDFRNDFMSNDSIVSNGVFGRIIKIDGWQLTIGGPRDLEKVIIVNEKTIIKFLNENKKISDLKISDNIVVIGEPNNSGQIEAKLIRVMPKI
jgi:hypothetical protein